MKRKLIVIGFAGLVVIGGALVTIREMRKSGRAHHENSKRSKSITANNELGPPITISADCITIEDPSGDDNGCNALQCSSRVFRGAVPHKSTPMAMTNLYNCLSSGGTAMIVGHGASGRIDTVEPGRIPSGIISSENESDWRNQVQRLRDKSLSALTLLGCSVGAQDEHDRGLKLMKQVIDASRSKKLSAPTGDIFCDRNGLYLEKGSKFREIDNSQLETGKVLQNDTTRKSENFRLRYSNTFGDQYKTIDRKDITIVIPQAGFTPPPLDELRKNQLLDLIDSENPEPNPACPISNTVGHIAFGFITREDGGSSDSRKFELLANGLLRDESQHDTNIFYRTSPQFLDFFKQFAQ